MNHTEYDDIIVIRKNGEEIDSLIRRFKKKVNKSMILQEYRRRMEYEKPSEKKKRKRREAIRRTERERLKKEKMLKKLRKKRKEDINEDI